MRAVIVSELLDTPVREVARAHGLDVISLAIPADAPAGTFTLDGRHLRPAPMPSREANECALLLHTSGTTSRPKLVPLTHDNLAASAANVAATLGLETDDRCLNVMPLFHIHGLVGALLASVRTGGSVVCSPGFHPIRIFDWLREFDPSWLTAVPTMHQALLARVGENVDVVGGRLRFIRSSSAPLPISVLEELEAVFKVPVIEAYGMTEAAHQMASNPLPPGRRKPGSVGPGAGPRIAILSQEGSVLPTGAIGEVAIRGENVFAGYEGDPEANAAAFSDGWFRTGDEGALDDDGYLSLHGRIKELINRGGEKIAPAEIDERLLRHPAVAEAVTFALPDPRLGEEVAAAVVLRDGHQADEADLQDFAAQTLAPFKVPRRIVLLPEIPKGSTGKLQRIGLAARLGIPAAPLPVAEAESPRNPLEHTIARIWASVLGLGAVSIHDDFFALGGDSILGAEAIARLRDEIGRPEIPLVSIVRAPTVAQMARELDSDVSALAHSGPIELHAGNAWPPFFLAPGGDGEAFHFVPLARSVAGPRPFYVLRPRGIDDGAELLETVEDLARFYLEGIRELQPQGPYILGGFCLGATFAIEMAHQLERAGEKVSLLVLIEPRLPKPKDLRYRVWDAPRLAKRLLRPRSVRETVASVRTALSRIRKALGPARAQPVTIEANLARMRDAHRPTPTDVPAVTILGDEHLQYGIPAWHVNRIVPNMRTIRIPIRHIDMLKPPGVAAVAREVRDAIGDVA